MSPRSCGIALLLNGILCIKLLFMLTKYLSLAVNIKKIVSLTIVSSALWLSSCKKNDGEQFIQHTIQYHISSSSPMNATYTDLDGTLKTASNVTSSWTYSFTTTASGTIVQLTIDSTNGSNVAGSIDIDGQQAVQNSSTGSTSMTVQIP